MKKTELAPTFEEFRDAIEERLVPMISSLRKTEDIMTAHEYIESEEGDSVVREHYELNLRRFNSGKLSRSIFMGDGVSGAAICLSMMYKPTSVERKETKE